MGVLNRDCVGTCPEAAESTARTKGSAIDRVSIRQSSARAGHCYDAARTTKARDIGLRTYRCRDCCGRLSDRDRLGCSAPIGILNRNRIRPGGEIAERAAVTERNAINCVSVRTCSARSRDCDAAVRAAEAGNIGLGANRG